MIVPLIKLMRPHNWTKNSLCLAGVIFGGRFHEREGWAEAGGTFGVFCLASSAVYVWNDILDRERDREHPVKRTRPIASGAVSVQAASILGIVLLCMSIAGAAFLTPAVWICLGLYLVNNILYSAFLKHRALVDVLSITAGFVLRLLAGIYAVHVLPSSWILLCTFFLSSFLGFAKRRAELNSLIDKDEHDQQTQRPVLKKYTIEYLDTLVSGSAMMTIMSYALFTTASDRNPSLVVTLPLIYYAIMHYQRLVMVLKIGEEPERIVYKDVRLIICVIAWFVLYMAIWQYGIHIVK